MKKHALYDEKDNYTALAFKRGRVESWSTRKARGDMWFSEGAYRVSVAGQQQDFTHLRKARKFLRQQRKVHHD